MKPHTHAIALRAGERADIPLLTGASVGAGGDWRSEHFAACFDCGMTRVLVAEVAAGVVGFCVYEVRIDRVRVLNIAVYPPAQRMGVGHLLASRVKWAVFQHRCQRGVLTVSEWNVGGQMFWKAQGWKATAVLHGAVLGNDQILFELRP